MISLNLKLPDHVVVFANSIIGSSHEPLGLIKDLISFGHQHIMHEGCGPFVAAIQEIETNKILSIGANVVVYWNQGWAHAERVAISLLQHKLNTFCLPPNLRLISTSQMCVACYGEALTTGFSEIWTSCTAEDVEELTMFKEGKLPLNWQSEIEAKGCVYKAQIERDLGRGLLSSYGKEGLVYFNAGSGIS